MTSVKSIYLYKRIAKKIKVIRVNNLAKKLLFPDKKDIAVLHGPFKGMKYPSYKAAGSVLWPKLLGTYEKELQLFIKKSLEKEYDYIIDVGCAEGYYAVGYALKANYRKIIAYDIDKYARNLCKSMCVKNGVHIDIKGYCTQNELESIDFDEAKYSLLFVDCEGYERELLSSIDPMKLHNVIMIVEVHDWCQHEDETTDLIINHFSGTHFYEIVTGIDDYDKAYRYDVKEIDMLPINERFLLLREGRKRLGKWLILYPGKIKTNERDEQEHRQ